MSVERIQIFGYSSKLRYGINFEDTPSWRYVFLTSGFEQHLLNDLRMRRGFHWCFTLTEL